ncbi:MAG: zinc metallopeptidase [Candidatus Hydrogenedentes bacterium]|nr:zinc metallopeptidase [Candidatus Hydrogenedentota bacterium]
MFFFSPYDLLLLPALLIVLWAQFKVKSAYANYSQVGVRSGVTGADIARLMLREEGIEQSVGMEVIPGEMTDHYDPRGRVLRLSEATYHGGSIASLGIAAHEVGHAIQHARGYKALELRNVVYPLCSIGETLGLPMVFIGFIMGFGPLVTAGILLFTAAVFFTIITLPVEFDASRRAVHALAGSGYMTQDEVAGTRKVLNAAAMTYVAAALSAILNLLRLVFIANSRD